MTAAPLVSVVIPSYNHQKYVGEAIRSVLAQDIERLEVVVIDDGSTDDSWAIIQGIEDPRLIAERQVNRGAHHALNRGIERARGEYIAILNSDDRFVPGRLAAMLAASVENGWQFIISTIRLIDAEGVAVADPTHWWCSWYRGLLAMQRNEPDHRQALLAGNYAISSSNFFVTRAALQQIGPFRPYRYVLDYDFVIRAARLLEQRFGMLQGEPLLDYRLHGANTIAESPLLANLETFLLIRRATEAQHGETLHRPLAHLNVLKRHAIGAERAKARRLTAQVAGLQAANDQLLQQNHTLSCAHAELLADRERILSSFSFKLAALFALPSRILRRLRLLPRELPPARPLRANSVSELRNLLEREIGDRQIVSFDIFDTLLERRVDPPEALFAAAARRLAAMNVQTGPQLSVAQILAARSTADAALRRRSLEAGNDPEYRFTDLAEACARELALDVELQPGFVENMRRVEIDVETAALEVKPGMAALLADLARAGKRLLAVSDMYLDEAMLREILTSKGIDLHFEAIYVSGEHRVGKYSGRLFSQMMAEKGISPLQVIHIGDHPRSDHDMPRRLGMLSIQLADRANDRRRARLRRISRNAEQQKFWRGWQLAQMLPAAIPDDLAYRYGYEVLGPIFSIFTLGLAERVQEKGLRQLFFLAREGQLFQRLFEILAPEVIRAEPLPACHYLYLSRKTVVQAGVAGGLSLEQAVAPLYNPRQRGISSICATFGLPPERVESVAQRHGYVLDEPVHDWNDARFSRFLEDPELQAIAREAGMSHRQLLEDYLRQQGFFSDDCIGLVDIGWNGTIQKGLTDCFAGVPDMPKLLGCYLALARGIPYQLDPQRSEMHGILYDAANEPRHLDVFAIYEEVFEEGSRALHATTVGYQRRDNGDVEPVLKHDTVADRVAELKDNLTIGRFHDGVLDCARAMRQALPALSCSYSDLRPFALALAERAVCQPRPHEVNMLMSISHSEDFGSDASMDFSADQGSRGILFSPRRLYQMLRRSNWRYGTMAGLRFPGGLSLIRLIQLRLLR